MKVTEAKDRPPQVVAHPPLVANLVTQSGTQQMHSEKKEKVGNELYRLLLNNPSMAPHLLLLTVEVEAFRCLLANIAKVALSKFHLTWPEVDCLLT